MQKGVKQISCDGFSRRNNVEVDMECHNIDRRGAEVNIIRFTVQY